MDNTKIRICNNCQAKHIAHEFQDNTYGKYKRVFNVNFEKEIGYCSVCGAQVRVSKEK